MNEKVIKHKAICDELNALYARKNHDYGDSFHQSFVEEGMACASASAPRRILPYSRASAWVTSLVA